MHARESKRFESQLASCFNRGEESGGSKNLILVSLDESSLAFESQMLAVIQNCLGLYKTV